MILRLTYLHLLSDQRRRNQGAPFPLKIGLLGGPPLADPVVVGNPCLDHLNPTGVLNIPPLSKDILHTPASAYDIIWTFSTFWAVLLCFTFSALSCSGLCTYFATVVI